VNGVEFLPASANLVLIGMPGCGKSTIGAAAARLMGRAFVDMDVEIERQTGLSVPEVFAREGEAAFRDREQAVAGVIGRGASLVIATGGGSVLREETMRALLANGAAVWLIRPVELLPLEGRPLSASRDALRRLERERSPLYEQYASARAENTSTIEEGACRAVKAFYALANP